MLLNRYRLWAYVRISLLATLLPACTSLQQLWNPEEPESLAENNQAIKDAEADQSEDPLTATQPEKDSQGKPLARFGRLLGLGAFLFYDFCNF